MQTVTVKWFRFDVNDVRKCMGFAFLAEGREIFFHWGTRHSFTTYGDEPTFSDFTFPDTKPITGDKLRCEVGEGRKGQLITAWGYEKDYQKALQEIAERKKNEQLELIRLKEVRLRCNPKFRVVEEERRFGKPTGKPKALRFEGTRKEFVNAVTPLFGQPLVFESGRVLDGYQYVRWFERETADGWVVCADPRKIDLPKHEGLRLETAQAILNNCQVESGTEMSFIGRQVRTQFCWKQGYQIVATGWDNGFERRVVFPDTSSYPETEFWDTDAYVLQQSGQKAEITIPDSRKYERINRRGEQKVLHDLGQLGPTSEWEAVGRQFGTEGGFKDPVAMCSGCNSLRNVSLVDGKWTIEPHRIGIHGPICRGEGTEATSIQEGASSSKVGE